MATTSASNFPAAISEPATRNGNTSQPRATEFVPDHYNKLKKDFHDAYDKRDFDNEQKHPESSKGASVTILNEDNLAEVVVKFRAFVIILKSAEYDVTKKQAVLNDLIEATREGEDEEEIRIPHDVVENARAFMEGRATIDSRFQDAGGNTAWFSDQTQPWIDADHKNANFVAEIAGTQEALDLLKDCLTQPRDQTRAERLQKGVFDRIIAITRAEGLKDTYSIDLGLVRYSFMEACNNKSNLRSNPHNGTAMASLDNFIQGVKLQVSEKGYPGEWIKIIEESLNEANIAETTYTPEELQQIMREKEYATPESTAHMQQGQQQPQNDSGMPDVPPQAATAHMGQGQNELRMPDVPPQASDDLNLKSDFDDCVCFNTNFDMVNLPSKPEGKPTQGLDAGLWCKSSTKARSLRRIDRGNSAPAIFEMDHANESDYSNNPSFITDSSPESHTLSQIHVQGFAIHRMRCPQIVVLYRIMGQQQLHARYRSYFKGRAKDAIKLWVDYNLLKSGHAPLYNINEYGHYSKLGQLKGQISCNSAPATSYNPLSHNPGLFAQATVPQSASTYFFNPGAFSQPTAQQTAFTNAPAYVHPSLFGQPTIPQAPTNAPPYSANPGAFSQPIAQQAASTNASAYVNPSLFGQPTVPQVATNAPNQYSTTAPGLDISSLMNLPNFQRALQDAVIQALTNLAPK